MIQNIKVDTIYYLTNSDFEMEFNLCGCCKMRLLTDKAENAKNFVGLLSRAVSRSQVIICCGKLFSDDGLIKIVSKAIKKPLTVVDNSAYSIADSNEIEIIEGSVPLVNSDGCFCGCIAESGPQSIILLTDNKGLRKTVLKQLIHPYIEELSIIRNSKDISDEQTDFSAEVEQETALEEVAQDNIAPDAENADANDAEISAEMLEALQDNSQVPSEVVSDDIAENDEEAQTEYASAETSEEASTQPCENVEENPKSTAEDLNKTSEFAIPEVIVDEEPDVDPTFIDPSEINSGFELYLEPERVKYSKKSHYALNYIPSERDNEFISESSDMEFFEDDEKRILNLPILIVIIILLVALAALAYLLVFIPLRSDYVFSEYIRNIFSVAVNFKPLL